MAKKVLGSFLKSKKVEGKPDGAPYIKLKTAVNLPEGAIIQVHNKQYKLRTLQESVAAGKLDAEYAEKLRGEIEKMPDWVLGDLVIFEDRK